MANKGAGQQGVAQLIASGGSGALVFTPSALAGWRKADLTDQTAVRVASDLRRLGALAEVHFSSAGRLGGRMKEVARARFGLDVALTDGSLGRRALRQVVDGEELRFEPHVKVSDRTRPDRCARIYFARSSDHRIVVAHVGRHL